MLDIFCAFCSLKNLRDFGKHLFYPCRFCSFKIFEQIQKPVVGCFEFALQFFNINAYVFPGVRFFSLEPAADVSHLLEKLQTLLLQHIKISFDFAVRFRALLRIFFLLIRAFA